MKQKLQQLLYDCCISATSAIKEIGISRNGFYSDKLNSHPNAEKFIESHQNDWIFTPEKLQIAVNNSGRTQLDICENIEVHNVTFNNFLKGKLRPTRATGDYIKVKVFCDKYE